MNLPNVFSFRSSHGAMQAKKTIDASTTPPRDRLPHCARRYQAHNPAAGRNESREVLLNAVMPQSKPNSIQGIQPSRSSRVRASQKIVVSNNAARLVSQIARVHQNMTFGSRAQAHAEPTATFSEKILRAIRKIGMQVSAEKTLFVVSSTKADALE